LPRSGYRLTLAGSISAKEQAMSDVYAGVDIGGTNIKIGLITGRRKLIGHTSIPTQPQGGVRQLVARSAQAIRDLATRAKLRPGAIRGVGIGAPGPLDLRKNRIIFMPNIGWRNVPFSRLFEKELRVPAFAENDANLAAWGEAWAGAGRSCEHFILLTLGTGIGGGIVLNGELWRGGSVSAAEIGHLTVVADGEPCGCGAKGCFEAYASATALVKFYRRFLGKASGAKALPEPVTAHAICEAAKRGDATARAAVDHIVKFLAIGITSCVKLIDPDKVILVGGMAMAGDLIVKPLREQVKAIFAASFPFKPKVVVGTLGDRAGMFGAAGWASWCVTRRTR
jgi:glucokinase